MIFSKWDIRRIATPSNTRWGRIGHRGRNCVYDNEINTLVKQLHVYSLNYFVFILIIFFQLMIQKDHSVHLYLGDL